MTLVEFYNDYVDGDIPFEELSDEQLQDLEASYNYFVRRHLQEGL